MSASAVEFSRRILASKIGAVPFRQEIAANEAERAALARRFDLVSLGRLTAAVELSRKGRDTILLRATFAAEFEQTCVVSLEPVAGAVAEEFAIRYGPPDEEGGADDVAAEDTFEPLTDDSIDIGEAVAQQFSLALPPFPRDPGAVIETEPESEPGEGAFAALARLRGRG